jgi:hypothetical protein
MVSTAKHGSGPVFAPLGFRGFGEDGAGVWAALGAESGRGDAPLVGRAGEDPAEGGDRADRFDSQAPSRRRTKSDGISRRLSAIA